ncbi:dienelactone hydrolase family protein [Noviherbaspirillum malthae]|jgi:putative phosphoribosyl transferase|uniref:dienelactone hydrolase family protein n=1 Tax=Noviherbaspirillum malthae TaxID=1260987 RepID=UPI00188FF813|nr:alpha/beta hydrolase [Noviherbaspirillum malthae]
MLPLITRRHVSIACDDGALNGMLCQPENALGVVVCVHGSSASRLKPPSDYVGSVLHKARLATLWLDTASLEQRRHGQAANDVRTLAGRLQAACTWLRREASTDELPLALFASGHLAAVALRLASAGGDISALVLRSARLPQPEPGLARITAPTLLIAGGLDDGSVGANRAAFAVLRCKKRFEVIPGATHAFEEPGSLEVVARLARGWFLQHTRFVLA